MFIYTTSTFYEEGNFFKKNKISVEKASEIAGFKRVSLIYQNKMKNLINYCKKNKY